MSVTRVVADDGEVSGRPIHQRADQLNGLTSRPEASDQDCRAVADIADRLACVFVQSGAHGRGQCYALVTPMASSNLAATSRAIAAHSASRSARMRVQGAATLNAATWPAKCTGTATAQIPSWLSSVALA